MNAAELRAEAAVEFELLGQVIDELVALRHDVAGREPTLRERAAAGAFLMQFYNGVENLLKRISKQNGVPLPAGQDWHADLFRRYCNPPVAPLPLLFEDDLASEMKQYLAFRHIVRTGYGVILDWEKMRVGLERVGSVFERFRAAVTEYLARLD